jgi:hypothetical protein
MISSRCAEIGVVCISGRKMTADRHVRAKCIYSCTQIWHTRVGGGGPWVTFRNNDAVRTGSIRHRADCVALLLSNITSKFSFFLFPERNLTYAVERAFLNNPKKRSNSFRKLSLQTSHPFRPTWKITILYILILRFIQCKLEIKKNPFKTLTHSMR